MSSSPNPLQGINAQNPLGWPGATGTNMPSGAPAVPGQLNLFGTPTSPISSGSTSTPNGNPGGFSDPTAAKNLAKNANLENNVTGQYRNQLIPQFASALFGTAGPAANFFQTLMNLGSPYYQQQQQASFNSGVNQGNNAEAQLQQRLNASGFGSAPSGLEAAAEGQQAQGQAQNLSQMYLQNLFNNEQMQLGGAQGLSQLASLFNPASLFGSTSANNMPQGGGLFSGLTSLLTSLQGAGGSGGGGGGTAVTV